MTGGIHFPEVVLGRWVVSFSRNFEPFKGCVPVLFNTGAFIKNLSKLEPGLYMSLVS